MLPGKLPPTPCRQIFIESPHPGQFVFPRLFSFFYGLSFSGLYCIVSSPRNIAIGPKSFPQAFFRRSSLPAPRPQPSGVLQLPLDVLQEWMKTLWHLRPALGLLDLDGLRSVPDYRHQHSPLSGFFMPSSISARRWWLYFCSFASILLLIIFISPTLSSRCSTNSNSSQQGPAAGPSSSQRVHRRAARKFLPSVCSG